MGAKSAHKAGSASGQKARIFSFGSPVTGFRSSYAQASLEYIIVLAIVLILGLAILAISGAFPSFAYSAQGGDSAKYWATAASPIAIIDYKQNNTNFSCAIENRAPVNINITTFMLTLDGVNYTRGPYSTLPPGGRIWFNMSTQSCTGRQSIQYKIAINYTTDYVVNLTQVGAKDLYVQCVD